MKKSIKYIILIVAAVLLLLFPKFSPNAYLVLVANTIGIYCILVIGFNILTGYTGLVSLGQAGFYAVGGYTTSILNQTLGWNPWLSMLGGILVTVVFGFIVAVPALRVKDKYLVLLTVGFAEIIRLLALNWISLTGGPSGITGVKAPAFFGIKLGMPTKFYYLVLVCVVLSFAYQRILVKSRAGRAFIAIREDEKAAELSGINLTKYKIKSFMISAFFCGLAGVLYAHLVHYVSPDTFTYNESVNILCMGIVGGVGTLSGPAIGAVILTILPELLRKYSSFRMIIYGVLLVVVIMASPGGINGTIDRIRGKRKAKDPTVETDIVKKMFQGGGGRK